MAFHVGQKVVCVKDTSWESISKQERGLGVRAPVHRGIYTIRTIHTREDGNVYLRFEELANPTLRYWSGVNECQFRSIHFRPVIERKQQTDISIFLKMLNPKKVDA